MWDLLQSVKGADVVQGVDGGAEAAVEAEDLAVDEGGQGEIVEEVLRGRENRKCQTILTKPIDYE